MSRTASAPHHDTDAPAGWTAGVMFTDVVASTALLGNVGELAWIELLDRHRRAAEAIVHRHGGHIAAFVGDGFMALLPTAEAAITCGMRMQTANDVQQLMEIRVGIDVGRVHRYRDDWYVGMPFNRAARAVAWAGAGQVVVCADAYESAREQIALTAIERHHVDFRGIAGGCDVIVVSAPGQR